MERIHTAKELPYKEFTVPDSIVTAKICTKSGKLAVSGVCDHAEGGSTVRTEYFTKGTVPLEKCDVHIKASLCWYSDKLAGPGCPAEDVSESILLIKTEPELLDWEGNVIEYTTSDTPNLLPTGYDAICDIHNDVPKPTEPVSPDEPDTELPDETQTPEAQLSDDAIPDTTDTQTPPVPTPTKVPVIFY